jgi:tRNA (guanine-N7-)-methyltransferase
MARRALRKIDPQLDLSQHLTTFEALPKPWDGTAVFGRHAPLEIEVGSGKGLFLASSGEEHPERDFLGIELIGKYARYCAARVNQAELDNVVVLHGDAARFFREWLPSDFVEAVHVYFPDPWWKTKHRKRRIMCEPFVRDIRRVLRPGGTLHFWSDVQQYFQATLKLIAEKFDFIGPIEPDPHEPQHDLDYRTHFERRMRMHGETVYRSMFRKPDQAPTSTGQTTPAMADSEKPFSEDAASQDVASQL